MRPAQRARSFIGGVVFAVAMWSTAGALTGQPPATRLVWWIGGLAFIGIELVAQLVPHLRGQPSFYDGAADAPELAQASRTEGLIA